MKNYNLHVFSLTFLFVLGNIIITLPFLNSNVIINITAYGICSVFLILIGVWLMRWGFRFKIVNIFFLMLVCLISAYGAINSFWDFVFFLKNEQNPDTKIFILLITLIVVLLFLVSSKDTAFLKYCLLSAVVGLLIIFIGIIGGLKYYNFSNLRYLLKPSAFSIGCFLKNFTSIITISFFVLKNQKICSVKSTLLGTAFGFFVLFICTAGCILTLGKATNTNYPYLDAIGVISSGSLYTRLDGIIYLLFFITSMVKICLCAKTVLYAIKSLFSKI